MFLVHFETFCSHFAEEGFVNMKPGWKLEDGDLPSFRQNHW